MSARDAGPLLCNSCGYSLSGLAADVACSECGRPVAESAVGGRAGSAWQRGDGNWVVAWVWAWWRTNWGVLSRARRTFSQVRLGRPLGVGLMVVNAVVTPCLAIGLLWATAALLQVGDATRVGPTWSGEGRWALRVGLLLVGVCVATWALPVLVVGLLGWWRGWARAWARAAAVCSHASAVWLAAWGVVAVLLGIATVSTLAFRFIDAISLGSVLLGFVWYVALVVLGTRRCLAPSALPAVGTSGGAS